MCHIPTAEHQSQTCNPSASGSWLKITASRRLTASLRQTHLCFSDVYFYRVVFTKIATAHSVPPHLHETASVRLPRRLGSEPRSDQAQDVFNVSGSDLTKIDSPLSTASGYSSWQQDGVILLPFPDRLLHFNQLHIDVWKQDFPTEPDCLQICSRHMWLCFVNRPQRQHNWPDQYRPHVQNLTQCFFAKLHEPISPLEEPGGGDRTIQGITAAGSDNTQAAGQINTVME